MFQLIDNQEQFNMLIRSQPAVLVYFTTGECSVCKVLKPKVFELVVRDFPLIRTAYVEINTTPGIAVQTRVFTVPTLIVYFEGKEFIRKSRSFGLDELKEELERLYRLVF